MALNNKCCLACGEELDELSPTNARKLFSNQSCSLCKVSALSSPQILKKANGMFWELDQLIKRKITSWDDLCDFEMEHMENVLNLWKEAANQGEPPAMYNLGLMYRKGCGVDQNNFIAFEWYLKAANGGHAVAQNNLAYMYQNGDELGTPASLTEAAKWYKAAADQEFADASYNLGVMFKTGQGVKQSDEDACDWFQKAMCFGSTDAIRPLIRNNKLSPYHYMELTSWINEEYEESGCIESIESPIECACY